MRCGYICTWAFSNKILIMSVCVSVCLFMLNLFNWSMPRDSQFKRHQCTWYLNISPKNKTKTRIFNLMKRVISAQRINNQFCIFIGKFCWSIIFNGYSVQSLYYSVYVLYSNTKNFCFFFHFVRLDFKWWVRDGGKMDVEPISI